MLANWNCGWNCGCGCSNNRLCGLGAFGLRGPAGPTGPVGPAGPPGATGPEGPAGVVTPGVAVDLLPETSDLATVISTVNALITSLTNAGLLQ